MIATLLLAVSLAQPDDIHLSIDGVDREAFVFRPTKPTNGKPPVLFMFHGHGGSAERCMGKFHAETHWPEAVVVYGQGLPMTLGPQSYMGPGWILDCNEKNRDIRFFDALRAKVLSDYSGDPNHCFAWGFSNGGMFMYTLWTMRGSEFAGFCSSGGCILTDDVKLAKPKPMFITISGNDNNVPTEYQKQAYDEVRKADHSQGKGTPYGDHGILLKGAQPVVMWSYNGGHEFPFECFPTLIKFFRQIS